MLSLSLAPLYLMNTSTLYTFLLVLLCPLLPAAQTSINDECSAAIVLPVNNNTSCTISTNGTFNTTTQSMSSCSGSNQARDVWYKFTATATTHRIALTNTNNTDYVMQIFSGTCSSLSSMACVNNTGSNIPEIVVLNNFIAGSTYYIRIYDYYANGSGSFTLCINTDNRVCINDECTGAVTVTPASYPSTYCSVTSTIETNLGATQSLPGCVGTAEDDTWFKFTAIASRQVIRTDIEDAISPIIEVFSGSCGNLVSMGCYGPAGIFYAEADMTTLTPSQTYYYRIYGRESNTRKTNIRTCINSPAGMPNDECSTAIQLPVNNNSTCALTTTGVIGSASQSMPSCFTGSSAANDVWYKFTATSSTHRVEVTNISFTDFAFEVFSGNCNSLTSIACINKTFLNVPEIAVLTNLVVGSTYYMRVYDRYLNTDGKFSICVSTATTTIPNNECTGAIAIVPTPYPTTTCDYSTTRYTTVGATQSLAGCQGTAEDDIWFRFTATSTRHVIRVNTEDDVQPVLQVYSGTCGSLAYMGCYYLNSLWFVDADLSSLTVGATYYYRVYGFNSNSVPTAFGTCINTPGTVANDECVNAVPLTVNNNTSCAVKTTGVISTASQSLPSCVNTGAEARDVWYKFTATAPTHRVEVTNVSPTDFIFQVFSGTCSSLNSIACVNNAGYNVPEVGVLNNLVPGNTYYIRVYDRYINTDGQFTICVNTATAIIPNDECTGALTIPVTSPLVCGMQQPYITTGATQSQPGCAGTAEDDIWFRFIATATRHMIRVNTEDAINPVLEVFRNNCGSLISLGCYYYSSGSYSFVDADLTTLTPGETYYYRIYGSGSTSVRTAIYTCVGAQQAMPVTLTRFEATQKQGSVLLSWHTATEHNNSGFELQCAENSMQFKPVAFIASKATGGTSNSPLQYSFEDRQATVPVRYYRLKQIDKDGKFTYSSAVRLATASLLMLSPNPTRGVLQVHGLAQVKFVYGVRNVTGSLVLQGVSFNSKLDLTALPPAYYVVSITTPNEIITQLVQKN
jgi:hypothetical protein